MSVLHDPLQAGNPITALYATMTLRPTGEATTADRLLIETVRTWWNRPLIVCG